MSAGNGQPEPEIIPPGMDDAPKADDPNGAGDLSSVMDHPLTMPRLTYLLYAIASVSGFPMLIGLILAYVARGDASPALQTHYNVPDSNLLGRVVADLGGRRDMGFRRRDVSAMAAAVVVRDPHCAGLDAAGRSQTRA